MVMRCLENNYLNCDVHAYAQNQIDCLSPHNMPMQKLTWRSRKLYLHAPMAHPLNTLRRRTFLAFLTAVPFIQSCGQQAPPMAKAARFVKPFETWSSNHLFEFLKALPPAAMLQLKKSQGLLGEAAVETALDGPEADAKSLQKHLLKLSSNIFIRPFKDAENYNYHAVVVKIAKKNNVANSEVESLPTFHLERALSKQLFVQQWDKLNSEQRQELLKKINTKGQLADTSAIVAMSGVAALAALQATVAFSGFAFYSTMSVSIAAAASAVGMTLPFAAYTGASTIVGALTGPIGWAILGAAALGTVALAGSANDKKTFAFICQLHAYKIEALLAAGVPESEIFKT